MKGLIYLPLAFLFLIFNCVDLETTEAPPKTMIPAFNNPEALVKTLSVKPVYMRDWKQNGERYSSSSDYMEFGAPNKNLMQNNIAYYLYGSESDHVDSLKLVLNINNPKQKEEALETFSTISNITFGVLKIGNPNEIIEATKKGKVTQYENDTVMIDLQLEKSKIDIWKLLIHSKDIVYED